MHSPVPVSSPATAYASTCKLHTTSCCAQTGLDKHVVVLSFVQDYLQLASQLAHVVLSRMSSLHLTSNMHGVSISDYGVRVRLFNDILMSAQVSHTGLTSSVLLRATAAVNLVFISLSSPSRSASSFITASASARRSPATAP